MTNEELLAAIEAAAKRMTIAQDPAYSVFVEHYRRLVEVQLRRAEVDGGNNLQSGYNELMARMK